MKRRRHLGRIAGDRVEIRLSQNAYAKVSPDSTGVCFYKPAAALAEFDKALEQPMSDGLRSELVRAREQLRSDLDTLQGKVIGNIPTCVFPVGVGSRHERVAVATHERFHAQVRRLEAEAGVSINPGYDEACAKKAKALFLKETGDAGKRGLKAAKVLDWGDPLEELLARTEELRQACRGKRPKHCAALRRDLSSSVRKYAEKTRDFEVLDDVETAVQAKFGSPTAFVRKALLACKVRR